MSLISNIGQIIKAHILEEWPKTFDSRQNIDVIYLDFRKDFGAVAHAQSAYGIIRAVLNWIKKFSEDRR